MKLSTLFTVASVVGLVFGLLTLLIPEQTMAMYGVELTAPGVFVARLFGTTLFAVGVLGWQVRFAAPSGARDAIVTSLLVMDVIGFVVSLMGQLSGEFNALGWSTVALYLLLALGFAYFRFMAPSGT